MSEHDKKFTLEILTPGRIVYSGDATYLRAPGIEGSFGVLANHIAFLTALDIGEIEVEIGGKRHLFATSGGFAEVLNNTVSILAETAEAAEEIDIERAKQAKERAEKRLREHSADINVARARIALTRALTRLRVASKA